MHDEADLQLTLSTADRPLDLTRNTATAAAAARQYCPSLLASAVRLSLGPFYGAIAVPSVTRCRCCGHRCAGGVRQLVATPGEWQCKIRRRAAGRSGEWAQHFSNASCLVI